MSDVVKAIRQATKDGKNQLLEIFPANRYSECLNKNIYVKVRAVPDSLRKDESFMISTPSGSIVPYKFKYSDIYDEEFEPVENFDNLKGKNLYIKGQLIYEKPKVIRQNSGDLEIIKLKLISGNIISVPLRGRNVIYIKHNENQVFA